MKKIKAYPTLTRLALCIICVTCFHLSQVHAQCITPGDNVWLDSWISCEQTTNPHPSRGLSHWVLFEFPAAESITESHIWNMNKAGHSNKGAKVISIDYSLDGQTWIYWGNMTLPKAPETAEYAGIPGPNFEGKFIKKILFTIVSTRSGGACAALSEVKFTIDQTACYGEIDECGICNGEGKPIWYRDLDGDGLGDPLAATAACSQPAGYVLNQDDVCDDVAYGWTVIGNLFKSNQCTQCHGAAAAAGGLDLTTYDSAIEGGNKCGPSIWQGTRLADIILDDGYNACSGTISAPSMNVRIAQFGQTIDTEELSMIQAWIDSGATENCDCDASDPDTDGDGVCDEFDACPGFNDNLIGTSCNDGNDCTINDTYGATCNCEGIPALDTDNDGVCDSQDAMPLNPCTADGIIDGIEPFPWTGSQSNDCDDDGVNVAQGDIDDFSACIDNYSYTPRIDCACGPAALTAGGSYEKTYGVIGYPQRAGGLPDGITCGLLASVDTLSLSTPTLSKGDQICVTIGFFSEDGLAVVHVNGLGSYRFPNTAGLVDYQLQEYCFEAINDGPQILNITEDGASGIRVDGLTYSYCPCTPSDPFYNSPDCQCQNNQEQTPVEYDSHVNVGGVPEEAGGLPDGIYGGFISNITDTLILSFPDIEPHAKICITAGFKKTEGTLIIEQSGQTFSFKNMAGLGDFAPQEFCFSAPSEILNQTLKITDDGVSYLQVDGGYMISCVSCAPGDADSDNDGICDPNDPCPFSASGDSDGDGFCDDIDFCQGFDDSYDSDEDGIPNGCDICFGFDDNVDTDGDGVPNGCDICEGSDDSLDYDEDGVPNGCDLTPCMNFISEITSPLIVTDKAAHIQVNTNGYVKNNASVHYTAGKQIIIENGFNVEQGSTFHASIGPCVSSGISN